MKKLDSYLKEAIENIRKDREVTKELLNDVIQYMSKDENSHKEVGQIAAKYVETLQRSNEQLVKLSTIIYRRESNSSAFEFSEEDKSDLYELIKETK